MPQDSLRSVVYRSFVTCDDPKGVAECKTIRKSKKIKNASTSHDDERRREKESKEELQNLSCFQMMEVSRGAERLNEVVIDSLSNRPSIDRPSKHIATDLLRGALDLQESLVMLGKLQEASKCIANSTKKHKEKRPSGCRVDGGNEFEDFEKPRISADRAPKDCYDELREVIRESLARQNLLHKVCEVDRKHSELCVDLPSSSSSQSSLIHSHSSGCSSSSIRHEKMQGPNLIAKLMGLEEMDSISKKMEKEWVPYRRSPLLDIDLPRPKKPQFMKQKVVREQRTLEEIIETIQFKGILGRKSVDGSFLRRDRLAVDGPPIVIMRPLRGDRDDDQINEGEHIKSRQMARKTRGEFPPRPQLKAKEPKQKLDKGKEGKSSGKSGVRPVKKAVDSQDRLSTTKMNHSKPLVPQIQKREVVPRKIDKISKVAPNNTRKPAETKDVKPQRSDKTQDSAKLTTVKHSRNVRENNASKSQIPRGKVAAPEQSMKPASLNPTVPKKNPRKGESNSKPSTALVKNTQSDGSFAISLETNIEESPVKNTEPEQITEEVAKASCMSGTENSGNGDDLNHIEDERCIPSVDSDQTKGCKNIISTRCLLLSSASFLNHVEELFDIGTHDSTVFQEACLPDTEVRHDSLLLDCSKEILERKSLRYRGMRNQWSQHLMRKPKCHLSMEQLAEDICDGIEDLQNYSKSCDGVVLADSIYPMLDRDLRWKEEVTGGWDSGWRKGYTTEAVDEVMHDVEELVLSEIVADVIIEIM